MRVTAHRLQGIYQEDHECVVDIYTAFQNALVKRSLSLSLYFGEKLIASYSLVLH